MDNNNDQWTSFGHLVTAIFIKFSNMHMRSPKHCICLKIAGHAVWVYLSILASQCLPMIPHIFFSLSSTRKVVHNSHVDNHGGGSFSWCHQFSQQSSYQWLML
jgi:hypothetical protein